MEEEEMMEGRELARTESGSSSSSSGGGTDDCEFFDAGSDGHFAAEVEEIPSFRWLTPSFRSNPPPPGSSTSSGSSSSEAKTSSSRPVVLAADASGGGWLPVVITRGWSREWKRGRRRWEEFLQNGGLVLQQLIGEQGGDDVRKRIFTIAELKEATKNFSDSQTLGHGMYGRVYKGILRNQVVAIKKSWVTDESQIEQFIKEVIILSQVVHRSIVRLLGCCLETKVPLLVYEFMSSGTLFQHIHGREGPSQLSWVTRLRIATETAAALAHLHSTASLPIIHGDVKSTNILLDENLSAKVSDFGASMFMPFEQTHVTTLVQGKFGYLDPEYLQTCQFTEKSDVYSFGVVLVELLSRKKPFLFDGPKEERCLALSFIFSLQRGCLVQILDTQILGEVGVEHLYMVAQLARRCLSVNGEDRPTMKEVTMELETFQNQVHVKDCFMEVDCSPTGPSHSCTDDAGRSDRPFVEARWLSPSFGSKPPPYSSKSHKKERQAVTDARGEWLPAFMRGWRYGRRRRKIKQFLQNGGMLLQQLISTHLGIRIKLFTIGELEEATENFSQSHILGQGMHGKVYKGILRNQVAVAIEKLKIIDQSHIEQFINEVSILSQVNHRNIVRLLGCCLETEVPLLIYEFVPNGALFDHIHSMGSTSKLSWETRLRIATETAAALAYLHCAASLPIIHGDVKSSSILLDDMFSAKISAFGASMFIPFEQDHVTTLIEGALGYLDPEYLQTFQFTEKSDVYSLGVVLAELLSSEKPISFHRPEQQRSLASHFISSLKSGRLEQILDAQILEALGREQLLHVAQLARRCLSHKGDYRPTMREVAMELEMLSKRTLWN